MIKLSSEQTQFIKSVFPFIGVLFFCLFAYITFVKGMIILAPIVIVYLIGLANLFFQTSKVVDFYVDYADKTIQLDNLRGKISHYKFSDLNHIKHNRFANKVKLGFKDKQQFIFLTKNFWALPGFGFSTKVDDHLRKIRRELC